MVSACLPTLSQSALSSHLCSLLHDHRTYPPPHLWPETNFQAVGIADNKIFKLKLKQQAQTQRGRQAAKCAQSSITPGPGNLVSQVCPLYSQSQELTFLLNERRSQPFDLVLRTICILFLPDSAAFFLH